MRNTKFEKFKENETDLCRVFNEYFISLSQKEKQPFILCVYALEWFLVNRFDSICFSYTRKLNINAYNVSIS